MVAIYVLRLEQNKFYVGMSKRNIERIWEHIEGKGAAWTKKYPPCEGHEILYFEEGLNPSDENRKTIEMMKQFGIHNVRGGDYCRVKLPQIEVARLRKRINSLKVKSVKKSRRESSGGFCIRCKCSIKLDVKKPFCLECYRDWQSEFEDCFENYCHGCGKYSNGNLERPLCLSCWRKNKPKIAKISLYNFIN